MNVDATTAGQEKHGVERVENAELPMSKKVRVIAGRETRGVANVENPELPVSKKVRTIAGLHVCIDDSADLPLITETCATMAVLEGEITDNIPGMYEPIAVPLPDKPVYGTKSGKLLSAEMVQQGRQREMDQMFHHGVVTIVSKAAAIGGKHIKGDWVGEDLKNGVVRSRFAAKEVNYFKRDDVTQSTPPVKAFRMLLSLCATRRRHCRKPRFFAIWDISVAFFNADIDELIFIHLLENYVRMDIVGN